MKRTAAAERNCLREWGYDFFISHLALLRRFAPHAPSWSVKNLDFFFARGRHSKVNKIFRNICSGQREIWQASISLLRYFTPLDIWTDKDLSWNWGRMRGVLFDREWREIRGRFDCCSVHEISLYLNPLHSRDKLNARLSSRNKRRSLNSLIWCHLHPAKVCGEEERSRYYREIARDVNSFCRVTANRSDVVKLDSIEKYFIRH